MKFRFLFPILALLLLPAVPAAAGPSPVNREEFAARVGYNGAEEWLKKNAQKRQALDAALREFGS